MGSVRLHHDEVFAVDVSSSGGTAVETTHLGGRAMHSIGVLPSQTARIRVDSSVFRRVSIGDEVLLPATHGEGRRVQVYDLELEMRYDSLPLEHTHYLIGRVLAVARTPEEPASDAPRVLSRRRAMWL